MSTTSGSQGVGHRDRLRAVGGLADDVEVVLGVEDHLEPGAHERLVVGDQDAHAHMGGLLGHGREGSRAHPRLALPTASAVFAGRPSGSMTVNVASTKRRPRAARTDAPGKDSSTCVSSTTTPARTARSSARAIAASSSRTTPARPAGTPKSPTRATTRARRPGSVSSHEGMDGDGHDRRAARGRARRPHRPGGVRPLGADPLRRRGPAHAAPAVRQPGPRERQAGRKARGLRRGGPRGDRRPPAPERGRPRRLRRALRPGARARAGARSARRSACVPSAD